MGERVTRDGRTWKGRAYKEYLCIDLGTSTGWATLRVDEEGDWEVMESGTKKLSGDHGKRFVEFHDWVVSTRGRFDGVYFEALHARALGQAAAVLGGLRGVLLVAAYPTPIEQVAIAAWKKAAIGKGNASKEEVMDVITAMGYSPETQDEADAIGIAVAVGMLAQPG